MESGLDGGEFEVREAREDGNLEGFEMVDDGFGIGGEGETGEFRAGRLEGGSGGGGGGGSDGGH